MMQTRNNHISKDVHGHLVNIADTGLGKPQACKTSKQNVIPWNNIVEECSAYLTTGPKFNPIITDLDDGIQKLI
jgi:hypothetical protein